MTIHPVHHLRRSLAGAVLGLIALILVSAVLGGALAAIRANGTIDGLVTDLSAARGQIDELQGDNTRLANQNSRILVQNRVLVRYLRRHGLEIPDRATTPSTQPAPNGGAEPSPKAPGPSPRVTNGPDVEPTAGPTTPSPAPTSGPTTLLDPLDLLCDLPGIVCLTR